MSIFSTLSGGRQPAFSRNGPIAFRTVILFFTGLMSVGYVSNVPEPCRGLGAH